MKSTASGTKKSFKWFERFIAKTEAIGNKLPHPWLFFVCFAVIVLAIAHLLDGTTFFIPGKADSVQIKTLLNADGFRYMLTNMVKNFINFPPIGLVLPIAIAVGICEETGLFQATVKRILKHVPKGWITAVFIFIAINSSIASDARYAIIIPIGATLFLASGRNPLIGIIAGYAAASGGLSACVIVGVIDAALAGITAQAAKVLTITASAPVNALNNWYFMFASTFMLTVVGTFVTEKIVAPMLEGKYVQVEKTDIALSDDEKRGLRFTLFTLIGFFLILLFLTIPSGALLRDPKTHTILPSSPFINSLVPIVTIFFMAVGIAYGVGARKIKDSNEIGKFMTKGLGSMSSFLVVCFFCAQFINYFEVTKLATFCAVKGAEGLQSIHMTGIPLLIIIVVFVAFVDLFFGSASAKWAMMASVLVPMLGLLGYSPSFTQAIYRVGDSVTNTISPLSYYYPFIIGMMQKYDPDTGIGTTMAYQIPYAITFLIFWTLLLIVWYFFGIPLGPGVGVRL